MLVVIGRVVKGIKNKPVERCMDCQGRVSVKAVRGYWYRPERCRRCSLKRAHAAGKYPRDKSVKLEGVEA